MSNYFPVYREGERVVKSSLTSLTFHGVVIAVIPKEKIRDILEEVYRQNKKEFKEQNLTLYDYVRRLRQHDKDCMKLPFYMVQPDDCETPYLCMESDLLPEIEN